MKFTSKERDAETGLDFFGARYMSSAQGRFTSVDPKQFSSRTLVNPQKWNKYAYTLNNPLASIDPDGREEIKLTVTGFIPGRNALAIPGIVFRGDNRSFDPNATSFRIRGTVTIETDPSVRANPVIGFSGTTSGSEATVFGKKFPADALVGISVNGSRDAAGNAIVNVSVDGKDPNTPSFLTPSASANLTFTVSPSGDQASVTGAVTPYPAFEVYATPAGGSAVPLARTNQSADPILGSPLGLVLGRSQTVSGAAQLPVPDDCKKTGTCK